MITTREKEILILIAKEKTTEEIAAHLYVSNATVESHRRNLIKKMEVKNSVGLVISALKLGLIDLNI